MTVHLLTRDSVNLVGCDIGAGPAVVFQHGLGGDEAQAAEVFPDGRGLRRLTLECRGQGRSEPGPAEKLSIATFAADVLAFLEARNVPRFVAGGTSMGAAIAMRLAVTAPSRVRALIMNRPAWLWDVAPFNMRPFAEVAVLMQQHDPVAALTAFDASRTAECLAVEAPDNLASLRGFITRPNTSATAALLAAIADDGPGVTADEVRQLRLPTLVLGNTHDAVHPLSHAQTLADAIPGARLVRVTPKAVDRARHSEEVRAAIASFIAILPADGVPK